MVTMTVIGTAHADRPTELRYLEQMKTMMQAADGGSSESGDSQSRAAAIVTFVVDVYRYYSIYTIVGTPSVFGTCSGDTAVT